MAAQITELDIVETIHVGINSTVHRAVRKTANAERRDGGTATDNTVILKVLSATCPRDSEQVVRYQREYELIKSLTFAQSLRAYRFGRFQGSYTIALEDFGGEALSLLLSRGVSLSVDQVLRLSCAIASQLAHIHGQGIIHKDINPSNIVWNRTCDLVKVIDFGISVRQRREHPDFEHSHRLEGTLPYIAPEQTGRMNRTVDYRADLYSLGATMYELLTGQVPFTTRDPLELIHCHLAQRPALLHELAPAVPEMISNVVMKLLAKTAEERYQSAHGVAEDLERCRLALAERGRVAHFALGEHDVAGSLQIAETLHGRAHETAALLDTYDRVAAGARAQVFISGQSGIGKTAVVRELYRPITQRRGLFISGKYEQFRGNIPHSAIMAAFRALIRHLLSEDQEVLDNWRQRILAAVDPNGQLLIDMVPEIQQIIGDQPPLSKVDGGQARVRFIRVIQQFLRTLCRPEQPLVLFLDDLQWADTSSLELIDILMADSALSHFLLIGAYRNEGSKNIENVASAIADRGVLTRYITLSPLTIADVTQMLANSLHTGASYAAALTDLAQLIIEKTGGSPLFVSEFLRTLASKTLLAFDPDLGTWRWDTERIQAERVTINVVDLLMERIQRLPDKTQAALRSAALLGSKFALQPLATLLGHAQLDVYAALRHAIDAGIIEPQSRLVPSQASVVSSDVVSSGVTIDGATAPLEHGFTPLIIEHFRFAHDRLQQACYELIPADKRPAAHLQLGRVLRDEFDYTAREDRADLLFAAVVHLNRGCDLITDEAERRDVLARNLAAGEAALTAQAAEAAVRYFEQTLAGLPPLLETAAPSEKNESAATTELRYRAHLGKAQAAARCGRIIEALTVLSEIWPSERDRLRRAAMASLLIQFSVNLADFAAARCYATSVLATFGIAIPVEHEDAAIEPLTAEVMRLLDGREIASLAALPICRDQNVLASLEVLMQFLVVAFLSNAALYIITGLHITRLVLLHGVHASAAAGLGAFGVLLRDMGDVHRGAAAGRAGIALAERFGDSYQLGASCLIYGTLLGGWVENLEALDDVFSRGQQGGLASGANQWVGFNMNNNELARILSGTPLPQIARNNRRNVAFISESGNIVALQSAEAIGMFVRDLAGEIDIDEARAEEVLDEDESLERWRRTNNFYTIGHFFLHKALCALLRHQIEDAYLHLKKAEALRAFTGGGPVPVSHGALITAMVQAQRIPGISDETAVSARTALDEAAADLADAADICPNNFRHMSLLARAEIARLDGHFDVALDLYRGAIAGAGEGGFIHHQAMANERLATLWINRGVIEYAHLHLTRARALFSQWGAARVLVDFDWRYRDILLPESAPQRAMELPDTGTMTTATHVGHNLDVKSIVDASQLVGSQLVLDKLLTTLLQVVFANAGAERGTLFLRREEGLIAAAFGQVSAPEEYTVDATVPIAQWHGGARAIVQYVSRTHEAVIMGRAGHSDRFAHDEYLEHNRVRSLLCIPLLRQGTLVGILYLENNLVDNAFTEERVYILQLLAGHIAISLENAALYADLSRALADANESNRLKTEFLAMTSHELRTPLNALTNLPDIVLSRMEEVEVVHCQACGESFECDPPEVRPSTAACPSCGAGDLQRKLAWFTDMEPGELVPLMRDMLKSSHYLLAVVNSILELSRLEFDRREPSRHDIDMVTLFRDIEESLTVMAVEKGIALTFSVTEAAADRRLHGDPIQIRQIVTNLVDNAIKYSPREYGRVDVECEHTSGPPAIWYIRVRDNGIGIPRASQEYIFDSFRQVDQGRTREHSGVGLGLAITKKLCDLHQGTICVHSEPGQGSLFVVELPDYNDQSGVTTRGGVEPEMGPQMGTTMEPELGIRDSSEDQSDDDWPLRSSDTATS